MRIGEINLKTLVLLLAVSAPAFAATDDEWLRLLHYRGRRSEIDSPAFFLSPNGATDPEAELQATIEAIKAGRRISPYDQPAHCAYPARRQYLQRTRRLDSTVSLPTCPEFEKWRDTIEAKAATLIFAAPFLGNPASMFGHTFLRLSKGDAALLDAGVSFEALPERDSGPVFAIKGLTGGYRGVFSTQPYFEKVQSYGELEKRDLWEFDLRLDTAARERLLAHLWELGAAHFDYYFFDENCSYHLLGLLEVAEPRWKLRDRFHVMTVPADTIRVLESQGALGDRQVRLAPRNRLRARLAHLNTAKRSAFHRARLTSDTAAMRLDDDVEVLDALIDWRQGLDPKLSAPFDRALLSARARHQAAVSTLASNTGATELGHRTSKINALYAKEGEIESVGLALRPILHDSLDASQGYVPHSSLIVGEIAGRYQSQTGKVSFDHLTIAEVENLSPIDFIEDAPSWSAGLRLGRPIDHIDQFNDDVVTAIARLGIGASTLISPQFLFSAFAKLHSEAMLSSRVGPTAQAIAIANWGNALGFDWKTRFDAEHAWLFEDAKGVPTLVARVRGELSAAATPYDVRVSSESVAIQMGGRSRSFTATSFTFGWYY